jgi:hypothetical protein
MTSVSYNYPHARALTIAGILALLALATAVVYEVRSTPVTMVIFLGGGSAFLVLAAVLFCWGLWRDITARLDSITTRSFAPGEVIYRQGEPAENVFVILKGKVEAVFSDPVKGEIVLAQLGPQEYFGESAILSRLPRQATARTVEPAEVLAIHRTDFLRLYGSLPRLRARIGAQQLERRAMLERPGARIESKDKPK